MIDYDLCLKMRFDIPFEKPIYFSHFADIPTNNLYCKPGRMFYEQVMVGRPGTIYTMYDIYNHLEKYTTSTTEEKYIAYLQDRNINIILTDDINCCC